MTATNLVPFQIPAHALAELKDIFPDNLNSDLSEGVTPSFAVVTFRGKVWRVRFKGEDIIVRGATGDAVPSIVGVLVKASPAISKLYYDKQYTEGDDAPPSCFSLDGVKPDRMAPNPQNTVCATCKHNVFGSRITESGSRAKACADNRRIAIVPYPDLRNESFGGPMLLRIPPTSLQELARMKAGLDQQGLPYQAVVVKISFDLDAAYPKLIFQAVRALTLEEAKIVREHMDSDEVQRMLMEAQPGDETQSVSDSPAEAQSGPQTAATPAAVQPTPATPVAPQEPAPAPAAPAEPAKVETQDEGEPELPMMVMAPPEAPAKTKAPSSAKAAVGDAEVVNDELHSLITKLVS